MKIEKLNDNQIRCTLDKSDLQSRNIKIDELAYGTDKANTLFKEMAQQANRQFGFQTDNTPLMVEAIPLGNESISLIITKVDDPEELDTRFSKFTPGRNDSDYSNELSYKEKVNKANELLGFLNSFREALAENSVSGIPSPSSMANRESVKPSDSKKSAASTGNNITLVFQFDDIDKIIKLSHVLKTKYNGINSLYRHNNNYYLAMQKGSHTPEEFNQTCNIICEFGSKTTMVHISEAYMKEHFELILKDSALQDLLNI